MRALVVDDSRTQAAELQLILEAAGLDAVTAPSAEAALARLAGGGIDIVLSDIVMPGLDGYALCRRIKATWPELPVVLLTSLSDPIEVIRALECGADNFLTKPYQPDHLLARVRQVLDNRKPATDDEHGVDVAFLGQRFTVAAHRAQILGLLVSTFEDSVRRNEELTAAKAELAAKHERLLRLQQQKEDLSALLVHDLKSPAAGIMMLANGKLRDPRLDEDQRRYWRATFSGAELISRMVMNLLDIARSDDGVLTPRIGEVDVAALLTEVQHLMAPFAADSAHDVVVDATPELPAIHADHELFRRVLQNLVDNAIRHSPSGSTVRIEATIEGDALVIRVRDQGSGVTTALRERIFEKYVRGDQPQGGDDFGKGLGLSFCRMAIEAHGGRIWVEDNTPCGSVFVMTLPR